jgi:hypothetical protein
VVTLLRASFTRLRNWSRDSLPPNQLVGIHPEGDGELADGARVRLIYATGLELEYRSWAQTGSLGELPLRQQTHVPNLPQPISTDARHHVQDCTDVPAFRPIANQQVWRKSSKMLQNRCECDTMRL